LGQGHIIDAPTERLEALQRLTEHMVSGRWQEARHPSEPELKQTAVLAVPITEASAKVRQGPPIDADDDYASPVWAGVLPLVLTPQTPTPDPRLASEIVLPDYIAHYKR
jgi:hypothetical protein